MGQHGIVTSDLAASELQLQIVVALMRSGQQEETGTWDVQAMQKAELAAGIIQDGPPKIETLQEVQELPLCMATETLPVALLL